MKVSIVIPSYNSENTIEKCLRSLKNQTYSGEYDIFLADSSVDRTPEIIRDKFPQINYHHFNIKTDPGTARNCGIKNTEGEIILFIDSDCIAAPDWIEKHVELHLKHPDVYAVGGAAMNGNDLRSQVAWAGYMLEFREFLPTQEEGYVDHIPTLNISFKRKAFEESGLFNPLYYPQEDLVFNYNITANGGKILFCPDIKVWHNHRTDIKGFLKHQRSIGKITSQVLKLLPLPGAKIARSKALTTFIGPLLPFVKFVRTILVFIKKNHKILINNPASIFIIIIGLIYWFIGFLVGSYSGKIGESK